MGPAGNRDTRQLTSPGVMRCELGFYIGLEESGIWITFGLDRYLYIYIFIYISYAYWFRSIIF